MDPQSLSWDLMSAIENEEGRESVALLHQRPFLEACEDSEECIEQLLQDDPFLELSKSRSSKKLSIMAQTGQSWAGRVYGLFSKPLVVRSAPPLSDSHLGRPDSGERLTLPIAGQGLCDPFKRLSADTAASLLLGVVEREFLFVDARFGYEFRGGHIRGALNPQGDAEVRQLRERPCIIIFYCEYSSVRAPTLARRFRNMDREHNRYPKLNCPEIYVLEGGYSHFFRKYPRLCDPMSYITMHDRRFTIECALECKKRKNMSINHKR